MTRWSWLLVAPPWPNLELKVKCRCTVVVGSNIIIKEEITESDNVLVCIPIIDYRTHIYDELFSKIRAFALQTDSVLLSQYYTTIDQY